MLYCKLGLREILYFFLITYKKFSNNVLNLSKRELTLVDKIRFLCYNNSVIKNKSITLLLNESTYNGSLKTE